MKLSKILREMGISFHCHNEVPFSSLGLTQYNNGDDVCTFLEKVEYINQISENVTMVITSEEVAASLKDFGKGVCIVENPRLVFFELHNYLSQHEYYTGSKWITEYGENCRISPHSVISEFNVRIGNNVIIEPFCVINSNTVIGDNCIIRTGSKIGTEGFEFKRKSERVFGVTHVGSVYIGDNVEIQSNTCIDKAIYPWDSTDIGEYTKIDNLVHISHGVKIGNQCMIVANSGIGGRTKIGNRCWVGLGSIIRNGIEIGDDARVNMGAVVSRSTEKGTSVTGNFAIDHTKFIENLKKNVL